MFLGKIKATISVLPYPPRGSTDFSYSGLDIRLAPYFQFGYISPNNNSPLGAGLELQVHIFPGRKQLFSIALIIGAGYTHLSWPQPIMGTGTPIKFLTSSNEFPSEHHAQISTGFEISYGLDSKHTSKGFDIYAAPQFITIFGVPQKGTSYGLGFHIPIGVRYNFY